MMSIALTVYLIFVTLLFFWGIFCSRHENLNKMVSVGLLLILGFLVSAMWFDAETRYDSRGRPAACTVLEEYQLYTLVHQTTSDNKTFAWVQNAKTKEMRLVELPEPVPAGMEQFTVLYPPDKKIAFIPPLLPAPAK